MVATRELDTFILVLPAYIGDEYVYPVIYTSLFYTACSLSRGSPMLVAEAVERAYEMRVAEAACAIVRVVLHCGCVCWRCCGVTSCV